MKVDFKVKVVPGYKVAYMIRYGPYAGQDTWRSEFTQLQRWAKKNRLRTGRWVMYFIDKWGERPPKKRRSVAALEIKGKVKPQGKIQIMKIEKQKVVSVIFNPDQISPDVIYYGLEGWLESKPYSQAARSREVYTGSPWTNHDAWASCEVQVPIKRRLSTLVKSVE